MLERESHYPLTLARIDSGGRLGCHYSRFEVLSSFFLLLSSQPRFFIFSKSIYYEEYPAAPDTRFLRPSLLNFCTHEWLSPQPVIYFHCQGENKIILPDVKEKNLLYKFKGIESWQPLSGLLDKKCKRCGFYELDRLKSDDVFDEWEFCPDEFLEGNYVHYKQKEFNATFICTECMTIVSAANPSSKSEPSDKKLHLAMAVLIGALASFVAAAGAFGIYKYWQKRKREYNQARFLKLFDEGDDIDNELYL